VLFEDLGATLATGECSDNMPLRHAREERGEVWNDDDARLFGFESELEANLTYIPMAVRFKLDLCGVKLPG
jgi:Conserved nitrate reductase-associated protein (Nitr_red_assoc)